ncbi:MAG: DMT family transporter [Bacteroidia bacterium]|nr:DMT family transporter [Bacteroidia bacterium]
MVFIALSIITSVVMLIILRLFDATQTHVFYALILNYFSAFICGITNAYIVSENIIFEIPREAWILTVIEGVMFITVFYWIAQTTKYFGISVASVANKMSLVFPVISAHILFQEPMDTIQWVGLLLAVLSVYLVTYRDKQKRIHHLNKTVYPVLVLIGSGIIDSIINYGNKTYISQNEQQLLFSSFVYLFALITGVCYVFILPTDKKTQKKFYYQDAFSWKNTILLGLLLGIPNYFNLYFIIQSLNSKVLLSGQIFLILNLGNIVLSTLVGILLFKEKIKWINWLGIGCATVSMFLIK